MALDCGLRRDDGTAIQGAHKGRLYRGGPGPPVADWGRADSPHGSFPGPLPSPPPEQAPGEGTDRPPLRQGDVGCGLRRNDGAAIQGAHKGRLYRGGGHTLGFPRTRE